jgi:hypothetical protein
MPIYILKQETEYPKLADSLKSTKCLQMYSSISIEGRGDVQICCSTWVTQIIGNLILNTPDEIINNNPILNDMFADMEDGKYSYCNDQCPSLSSFLNNHPQHDILSIEEFNKQIGPRGISINLNYDQSCNLQCPSCRNEFIMFDPYTPTNFREIHLVKLHSRAKELVQLLLNTGKPITIGLTGGGDPFASPLVWGYLKELAAGTVPENLFINLQTNGILMNEAHWNEIKPLWKHIVYVNVSIDAVESETYKVVRKNGSFKQLNRNLELFDSMMLNGDFPISSWQTNFIVQRDNFRELKKFIEWQLTFKSKPTIWTHLLAHWPHIPDEAFNDMAIHIPTHRYYRELKEIVKDPIFNNTQVKLGNLNSLA